MESGGQRCRSDYRAVSCVEYPGMDKGPRMGRFLLGTALGVLVPPGLALASAGEDNAAAPAARAVQATPPVPSSATPPIQTPDPLPPPSEAANGRKPQGPVRQPDRVPAPPSSRTPAQPANQPILLRQTAVPAPHQRQHVGPIRATVRYADWAWTRGMIVLCGYPKPRDVQKRAAEPQAYTLPQTKPAPPPRPPLWPFHH